LRWVPPLGALGVATGAIAIGAVAMSTSTITIISIRTTVSTASKEVSFNTIRNIAETLRMGIGRQPINSADVAPVEPAVRVALVAPEDPVVSVVRVALVVLGDQVALVELAVRAASEELVVEVGLAELAVRAASQELVVQVVVLEPGLVLVAAGLAPVAVAVALRTKWVTAAHHRGQVAVLEEEDLAAVAETTRAPAAIEAAVVWAAAATAVAAVAVVAVVG
jgi:hypothetical protein